MSLVPKYRSLRGMPDVLPAEMVQVRWIEDKAREVFRSFGYREIRTPLVEETDVFVRSIGQDTDIVEKEMYSFEDRGGKKVSLRPEGTASIIRAYIEHNWNSAEDVTRLFYAGPMFRGERPQKGRLRQFYQIGAEIIGVKGPYVDAELIINLKTFLSAIKIDGFTILLNSLGCADDRANYKKALTHYLETRKAGLCENCQRRMYTNVLRVLDCKVPECKAVVGASPSILDYLCGPCGNDYNSLKKILSDVDIPFREKKDLVRGLDYYTGTIFEVVHPALGSQDAIAAGGRYDGLAKKMGGQDAAGAGYAVGIERLLLVIDKNNVPREPVSILVIALDDKCREEALKTSSRLWEAGYVCVMEHSLRSLKGQLRKAHKDGHRFVLILGEEEIKTGKVVLKDMELGEQKALTLEEVLAALKVG